MILACAAQNHDERVFDPYHSCDHAMVSYPVVLVLSCGLILRTVSYFQSGKAEFFLIYKDNRWTIEGGREIPKVESYIFWGNPVYTVTMQRYLLKGRADKDICLKDGL